MAKIRSENQQKSVIGEEQEQPPREVVNDIGGLIEEESVSVD